MQSINFEGAREIKKPEGYTDEECMSVWASHIPDGRNSRWIMLYQPSYEDQKAIAEGRPIVIQLYTAGQLIPHAVFTYDENGESNDAG